MKVVFALVAALLVAALLLPQVAAAQETVALAVEGWRQETRNDIVYYRCASEICAAGSVVSTKRQPHRPAVSLAEFETHHRGLAKQNSGSGNVITARVTEARQRVIDGVRVIQISREVEWTSKTKTFTIEARLIGKGKSFSLVSDSPKLEWTVNNFEGFLRRMVDIAGIEGN